MSDRRPTPDPAEHGWLVVSYHAVLTTYEAAERGVAAARDSIARGLAELKLERAAERFRQFRRASARNLLLALRFVREEYPDELAEVVRFAAADLGAELSDVRTAVAHVARQVRELRQVEQDVRKELEALRRERDAIRYELEEVRKHARPALRVVPG